MRREKLVFLGSILICAGAPACGGSVEATGTDGGGGSGAGGATATETTGGAGGSSSTGGLPEGFCEGACAATADGTCFSTPACIEYCDANAAAWPPEIGAAFASCAAENPLCFETVEGCILSELHPPGSLHTVRLEGSGFGEHEGKVVHVWHDPGTAVSFGGEAVITGGAFSFEWEEPIPVFDTGSSLLLLYIDVDGDQACEGSVDLTASVSPAWNGDYLAPVFTAVLAPPLADPDFVCDFPP